MSKLYNIRLVLHASCDKGVGDTDQKTHQAIVLEFLAVWSKT